MEASLSALVPWSAYTEQIKYVSSNWVTRTSVQDPFGKYDKDIHKVFRLQSGFWNLNGAFFEFEDPCIIRNEMPRSSFLVKYSWNPGRP